MATPYTKDACDVAANLVTPLHPPRVRLKLGHDFILYPQDWVRGGEALLWVYIPNLDGGRLTVEFGPDEFGAIRLSHQAKVVAEAKDVRRLVHDVPRGTFGRFEVRTSPPSNRIRARLRQEWLATDGAGKPLIPWNFWYYPFAAEPEADIKSRGFSSRAVQRSALRKCDRLVDPTGKTAPALKWETDNLHIRGENAPIWEGHCDGAAAASVYFVQPTPVALPGVEGGFTVDEMEFIAAEWAGHQMAVSHDHFTRRTDPAVSILPGYAPYKRMGQVTSLLRPDELRGRDLAALAEQRYAALFPAEYADTTELVHHNAQGLFGSGQLDRVVRAFGEAGLQMYLFLSEVLGRDGHPVIVNLCGNGHAQPLTGSAEIWNHALFYVTSEFTERVDRLDSNCQDQPLDHDIHVHMFLNVDARPGEVAPQPATIGAHGDLVFAGAYAERSFALRVSYSMHGDITGLDGRHFLDTWAAANAGRWLPASLMVLAKPDGSWEEYNPKIPPQVAALLRRRPRYR